MNFGKSPGGLAYSCFWESKVSAGEILESLMNVSR